MERITGATVKADLFGAGRDGFTAGTPGVEAATVVTSDFMNQVQEEISNVIEGAALALSANDRGQLGQVEIGRMEMQRLLTGMTAFSTGGSGAIHGIALNPGGTLVVVGANAEIYTSADFGVTWTARTAANSYAASFRAVCWAPGPGLFVAVGDNGEIQTSQFGTSWTHRTSGTSSDLKGVVATSTEVVALSVGAALQSVNATTWTSSTVASGFNGADLTVHENTFYACGSISSVAKVYSSTDGSTWTNIDVSVALVTSDALDLAAARDTGPAFSGTNGSNRFVIVYKPDSSAWVRMNQTLGSGVALIGRALCALLGSGTVGGTRSYDGVTAVPCMVPSRTYSAARLVRVPSDLADAQMLVLLGTGAGYISGLIAG